MSTDTLERKPKRKKTYRSIKSKLGELFPDEIINSMRVPEKEPTVDSVFKKKEAVEEADEEVVEEDNDESFIEDDEVNYSRQTEAYNNQNKKTLELINRALDHVRVFDSKDTALKLVNKAFAYCPSIRNKHNISTAAKSLKAAIKAESWSKRKSKMRHIRANAISNNLETFFESISEAAMAIQVDVSKNNKTFFNKIKKDYHSELPITISESKSSTVKTAPVVFMAMGPVDKTRKIQQLEHSMFLIEDATLIGINTDKVKKPYDKATAIASKRGATVYEKVLSRPSTNIQWFLVLDFNCYVKFASFPEFLDTPSDDNEDLSYAGLAKKHQQMVDHERSMKNKRLRDAREQFLSDNSTIIKDMKTLRVQIDNMLDARRKINEEFIRITTVDETVGGLDMKFRNRLHAWSLQYREFLKNNGTEWKTANLEALRLRVEANSLFFEAEEIKESQKELNEKYKFLDHMLQSNKRSFAERLGLVSLTKITDLD